MQTYTPKHSTSWIGQPRIAQHFLIYYSNIKGSIRNSCTLQDRKMSEEYEIQDEVDISSDESSFNIWEVNFYGYG